MSVFNLNRHSLSAVMVAVACAAGVGSAQASVSATVALDSGLIGALSFINTTVSAAGTGVTYSAGSFLAPIASVTLSTNPGPALVTWSPTASLTLANATVSAVFSGFVYDAATSEITADIAFTSPTLVKSYNDVGFLKVTTTSGSLASVSASSAVTLAFAGTAFFDMVSLSPIITALQVPSSISDSLATKQVGTVSISGTTAVSAPAVPEPSTTLSFLVGAGLLGGFFMRRRAK